MRSKSEDLINKINECINELNNNGQSVSNRKIANKLGVSKSTVSNYIAEMRERGMIENDNIKNQDVELVPLIGTIACGDTMLAQQNIERYIPMPRGLLGSGEHFALTTQGQSMINAGIDEGDCVFFRIQNTAEEGQIVVARVDDEATLKRYFIDRKRKQIRLHPENDNMEDMYFDHVDIQAVAVKVLKDLF